MNPAPVLVSVILPVYNGQRHISAALDSVQMQTHHKFEILAVDDGSTDDSGRILCDRAEADARIRVFTQSNHGVSAARNRAIAEARGEWVIFLDADDMIADRRLLEVLNLVADRKFDMVQFATTSTEPRNLCLRSEAGEIPSAVGMRIASRARTLRLAHRRMAEMIVDESANPIWGRAYRRSLLEAASVRFREGLRMGEDLLFNLDCFEVGCELLELPITGYFYRRTSLGSATNRYLPEKFRDLTIVGDRLGEWARATGSHEVIAAAEFIRAKNVVSCMRDLHHPDCDIPRRNRVETARAYRSRVPKVDARGLQRNRQVLAAIYNLVGYRTMFRLSGLIGVLR